MRGCIFLPGRWLELVLSRVRYISSCSDCRLVAISWILPPSSRTVARVRGLPCQSPHKIKIRLMCIMHQFVVAQDSPASAKISDIKEIFPADPLPQSNWKKEKEWGAHYVLLFSPGGGVYWLWLQRWDCWAPVICHCLFACEPVTTLTGTDALSSLFFLLCLSKMCCKK